MTGPVEYALKRAPLAAASLIILTSSFDIFLVFEAGGNFRIGQAFVLVLVALAMARTITSSDIPTLGLAPLLAWLLVQITFIPATDYWPKSVGYCLWLVLNVALVFSFVQLFSTNRRVLYSLLRCYLYSFGIMAIFGLIQFTLPLLGLPAPFITQWWIQNRVARLNGLSYEPSYYAAYLLIGFVFCGALAQRPECTLLPRRTIRVLRWLAGIAILLSSSRLGIAFLSLDIVLSWISRYLGPLKSPVTLLHRPIRPPKILRAVFVPSLGILVLAIGIAFARRLPETTVLLLGGTGLYGSASHSVLERANSFFDTLTVFMQHPFLGRSLGGVSSGIAELHGATVRSFQDSKPYEGMAIFAEALAASGVFGIIPFLAFLATTIYRPLKLARSTGLDYSILLGALIRSLIFEWAVLQFNQNILRPYLWVHLAILAAVYAAARTSVTPLPESRG